MAALPTTKITRGRFFGSPMLDQIPLTTNDSRLYFTFDRHTRRLGLDMLYSCHWQNPKSAK